MPIVELNPMQTVKSALSNTIIQYLDEDNSEHSESLSSNQKHVEHNIFGLHLPLS